MFDIGFLEMMVIGVLALIVLGPERLPGAIKSLIQTVRSVKEMANGFKQEVSAQIDAHELHANLKKAEALGMQNIGKDLQASVDQLKEAAASVQRPYKKDESNTIGSPSIVDKSVDNSNVDKDKADKSLAAEYQGVPLPENLDHANQAHADFDDYQHNETSHQAEASEFNEMLNKPSNAESSDVKAQQPIAQERQQSASPASHKDVNKNNE